MKLRLEIRFYTHTYTDETQLVSWTFENIRIWELSNLTRTFEPLWKYDTAEIFAVSRYQLSRIFEFIYIGN